MYNINDVLTMNNDEIYVVISKVFYQNKYYYYLINKNEVLLSIVLMEENNELIEVLDISLLETLYKLFSTDFEETSQTE